ncbi:MAG TPA: ROK family protein [Flavisolibacter sp.]|jgi:glucokinase|nr:ROK family protein [Flavisolibacter sp.]
MNSFVVGVDIGGTHITAAVINLEKQQIQQDTVCRQFVDANGSSEKIISSWGEAISKCIKVIPRQDVYIGIAMPGPFDYAEGISYIREQDKFQALYEINVKQVLAKKLGISVCNIQFLNDAASFLKGEIFCGAAQNHTCVYGITLGTGFGSALFKAEVANDANLWCSPFKDGIAEDYFSTRWFVQQYARKTGRQIKNVKALATLYGKEAVVKEIFTAFGENLAEFYVEQMQNNQPEMIVIGGNISNSFDYFYPSLQRYLKEHNAGVVVKKSILHETASLIGAASSWSKVVAIENNLLA